jgi:nicotinamidase-related amidase
MKEVSFMLELKSSVLLVIDVQEKLFRAISEKEKRLDNLQRLVKGIQVLEVPLIVTEQYPKGLGPTVKEIADLLPGFKPIAKTSFSCCGDKAFSREFKKLDRKQVLLAGIESHVCVYQTAADLIGSGYEVHAVGDAISSRTEENRQVGLKMMEGLGVKPTSTETVLFELLKIAEGDKFKAISKIVR